MVMNKRSIFSIFLVAVISLMIVSPSYALGLKIGYVDFLKIFNDYQKTQDYETKLENKRDQMKEKNKLEQKEQEIQEMRQSLEALKEEKKQEKTQEIREKYIALEKLKRKIVSDLKAESDEKMEEIIDDIESVIEQQAKKRGYDMIVNENAILYGGEKLDLTDTVLKTLNKQYQASK
jgi:outer membrane protein